MEYKSAVSEADILSNYRQFMQNGMVHIRLLSARNSMVYLIHNEHANNYRKRTILVKCVPIDDNNENNYIFWFRPQTNKIIGTKYGMSGIKESDFNNEIGIQKYVYKETLPNSITSCIFYHSILDISNGIDKTLHKFLKDYTIYRTNMSNEPIRIGIVVMEYFEMDTIGSSFRNWMIRDDNLTTIITSEEYGEGVRGILAKCFYGLILLTRIGVIHGDPHFDNVLLYVPQSGQIADIQIRIIDFGRSKSMEPNERATFSGIYENFLAGATLENFKILANYIYELNNQIFIHFHQARYDLRYGWIITETILELIFPLVVMECAREAAHNGNGAMQAAQPDNGNGAIQAEQHDNGNESNEPNTKKRKATDDDVVAKGIHRRSKKRKNPKNRTKRK